MPGSLKRAVEQLDKRLKAAWRREIAATGLDVRGEFQDVVRTWEHRPTFAAEYQERGHLLLSDVYATGRYKDIWRWVDQGTGEYGERGVGYIIQPKDPTGLLRFQTGYSARTAPIAKANVGTGQSYGDWVSAKEVYHPGIKPRLFSNTAAEDLSPPLVERIKTATRRAV